MTAAANVTSMTTTGYPDISDGYLRRNAAIPVLFFIPMLFTLMSWLGGGVPALTDFGFTILTLLCTFFVAQEIIVFPRRFGIGGLVLFGGTLTWFCHDYMTNWFGADFANPDMPFTPELIAKVAFLHCLFIACMATGLMINRGRFPEKFIHGIPEPTHRGFYLFIVLLMFAIGMTPYLFFTTNGPTAIVDTLYYSMTGGRGRGVGFTVGRSGNINVNWGGYIVEMMRQGQFGAVFAGFYALLLARKLWEKVLCWSIWLIWLGLAFGSGTRGQVVFVGFPVLALIYIKYQAYAAALFQKFSKRAYLYAFVIGLVLLFLIQFQGQYRGKTFRFVDPGSVNMVELQGNSMFSEGLQGYQVVPDEIGFFANRFPGEGAVRAIPETAFWFAIGPIPRALWRSKPVDPVWAWYNYLTMGTEGSTGTTVSKGLVGSWYFRYGLLGLIQGALLYGWLIRVTERGLQNAQGRPFSVLFSLAICVFFFRQFRDVNFNEFYGILIGWVLLQLLVRVHRMMFPATGGQPMPVPA